MEFSADWHLVELWQQAVSTLTAPAFSLATFTSYALIVAAEMGDKSQLVCMSLAAKHKGMPVFWGALAAYALLNALAVIFGSVIASWLPEYVVAFVVSLLFAVFGVQAWFTEEDDDDEEVVEKSGVSVFATAFLLITMAEFGDKTQLAVVALSSGTSAAAVWLGATAALATTSAVGVITGRTLLQKLPLVLLHKLSAVIFLLLSGFAAWRMYQAYDCQ